MHIKWYIKQIEFHSSAVDLNQHVTDCLCCWIDGTDGGARLGVQEGGRLLSVVADEGVGPAAVERVVEVGARVVPVTVQNCVGLYKTAPYNTSYRSVQVWIFISTVK